MKECFTGAQGAKEVFLCPLRLLTAFLAVTVLAGGLFAQGNSSNSHSRESERAAQVRSLNNTALQLHAQMQENAGSAAAVRGQAANVLAQRAAALSALMQEDAHAALSFSFSAELLEDLAAKFPSSAAVLESHVAVTGPVEHWVMDSPDLKTAQESWVLNSGGVRLNLHFSKTEVPVFNPGPTVTVEGVRLGSDVAVSKVRSGNSGAFAVVALTKNFVGSKQASLIALSLLAMLAVIALLRKVRSYRWISAPVARQAAVCALAFLIVVGNPLATSAQNSCSTTGAQNIAVLIVNFQDAQVSVTPQQVNDIFFDTSTGHSLNGYWQEASYGQTWATGGVFGPFTIGASSSYTCVNISQIFYDTVAAASASGVNLQNYSRINIVFPGLSCGWAGVTSSGSAGAGCSIWSTPAGTLTASVSYLISSYMNTRDQGVMLVAHENGHQLGLDHAGTVTDLPTAVLGPSGSPGAIGEFNDFFSTMGAWTLATYSAQHKSEILNWMASGPNYQLVQSSGTYTLQPIETNPPALQGLKIQRGGSNPGDYLWVEYRQPTGNYDSTIHFMNFGGALIHYQDATTGKRTRVMDFTASDIGSWYNTVLAPGQTWTDAYSNVSISVQGATPAGLTLSVSYGGGGSSCTTSAPTVAVTPPDPSIYAGQTASYTVSVTNNDSSGCGASTISLGSPEPAGWSTSLSTSTITLNPGQSGSVTLGKSAPSGTSAGTYAVNVNAAKGNANAYGNANATVVTAPALAASLSVAGASFTAPSTVSLTASVTNGGSPASGATVKFTVRMPNGSTATQSATTNSSGLATWNYRLNGKALAGSYSATAQASLGSGSKRAAPTAGVSSNSVTFTVQ